MNLLAEHLLDAGLIQFGWFHRDGAVLPFALHFEMLASYPEILDQVAQEAQAAVRDLEINRLLCTADAVPLGVGLSLRSGIPLVYSRGTADQPVFDLVGAYDIGHPALLLTNSLGWHTDPSPLVISARRVGLDVQTLVTLLEVRSTVVDGSVRPLLRLGNLVSELAAAGRLPNGHSQAVLAWLTMP